MDVLLHQLQQQRSHNVGVIFQFPVQSHRQQGGKIDFGPGVEVITALQSTDELQTQVKTGEMTLVKNPRHRASSHG